MKLYNEDYWKKSEFNYKYDVLEQDQNQFDIKTEFDNFWKQYGYDWQTVDNQLERDLKKQLQEDGQFHDIDMAKLETYLKEGLMDKAHVLKMALMDKEFANRVLELGIIKENELEQMAKKYGYDLALQNDAQEFTSTENDKKNDLKKEDEYSIGKTDYDTIRKYAENANSEEEAWSQAMDYLEAVGKLPQNEEEAEIIRRAMFGDSSSTEDGKENSSGINWDTVIITKTNDTWNGVLNMGGLFGHTDTNDEFNIGGKIYTTEEIESLMKADGVEEKKRETILRNISELKKNTSYSFSGK